MPDQNFMASTPLNYQIPGRVSLFFRKKGSTNDADWRDLGNVIDPQIVPQIERLDHFSMRRGRRAKDRSEITQRGGQLNFSIDEINLHNLMFAFGATTDPEEKDIDVMDTKVVDNPGSGGTIDLGLKNIDGASVIVRSAQLEDQVTYTVTTDYTVDATTGILTIGSGALASADPDTGVPRIHIFFKKNVDSLRFEIFDGSDVEGEAKFQLLTKGGVQSVWSFGRVILRNNGNISVGDGTKWQEIALQMDLLEDQNGVVGTEDVISDGNLDED